METSNTYLNNHESILFHSDIGFPLEFVQTNHSIVFTRFSLRAGFSPPPPPARTVRLSSPVHQIIRHIYLVAISQRSLIVSHLQVNYIRIKAFYGIRTAALNSTSNRIRLTKVLFEKRYYFVTYSADLLTLRLKPNGSLSVLSLEQPTRHRYFCLSDDVYSRSYADSRSYAGCRD